jgi:DNA-binding NarL/FixJ family response regulator
VGDAALAVALAAAFSLATRVHYDDPRVGIVLILLQTLPLALRRWYPVEVLAVVVAATLATMAAEIPGRPNGGVGIVLLVALYSVAAHCPRRQAAWAGIAAGAILAWPLWTAAAGIAPVIIRLLAVVVSLVFPALGWLCGAYVSELRARAARSRREQELETGRAVAEEQARVGRELHDVIAHTLSVIVIQAGAAQDVFDTSPDKARQALGSIGAAGRQALAELRRRGGRLGAAAGAGRPRRAAGPGPGHRPARDRPHRRRPGGPARRAGPGRLPHRAGGPDEHAQARPGRSGRGSRLLQPGRARPGGHRRRPARGARRPARARPGTGADRHPRARGTARRDLPGRAAPGRRLRGPGQLPAVRGRAVMTIRVLLCDDQALVRGGFRMILEARPDLQVVGEAEDGAQAVSLARQTQPDVILTDVRMPHLDGVEATRQIVAAGSPARILVLTTYDLDEYVYAAIRAGASGFLLKDVQAAQLTDAIRVIAAGDALLAPSVTRRLLGRFARALPAPRATPAALSSLTERETEVLRLLAGGLSNAELAGRLYISEATVKSHVSSLLRKLGLRDRVQAVILAYDAGLVIPQPP